MADHNKVNDNSEIQLIFTSDEEPFIPMFWIRRHDDELNVFSNYVNRNNAIHLWTFDHAQQSRFSLHFICYLLKHLMRPACCDPEKKELAAHWTDNVFTSRHPSKCFAKLILENFDEAKKIIDILNEIKKKLPPNETLHSHLDNLPSIPLSVDDKCLSCQNSQRGYNCRNCIHHNMILLEIIHRPECWTCLMPSIYVSMPMKIGPLKEYIFFIDLKKGIVTVGWEKHNSVYRTRYQECIKNFDIGTQRFKLLPLLWSVIPMFRQCSKRDRTPTLMNYISPNYKLQT